MALALDLPAHVPRCDGRHHPAIYPEDSMAHLVMYQKFDW